MDSIQEQINSLYRDRDNYKNKLNNMGIDTSNANTFTDLNLKLDDINIYKTDSIQARDNINAKEGDICLLYKDKLSPITQDNTYTEFVFPEIVVFDEAIVSYHGLMVMLDHGDLDISVSNNYANVRIMGDEYIDLEYTTSDGITYTRNGVISETTLGQFRDVMNWDDICAKFMLAKSKDFSIYEYKNNTWSYLDIGYTLPTNRVISGNYYDSEGAKQGTLESFASKNDLVTYINLVSNFDTSNITDFSSTYAWENIKDSFKAFETYKYLDTSNATNMFDMFFYPLNMNHVPQDYILDLSHFNTNSVTNMANMFRQCYVENYNLSSFNTENVTNMSYMFFGSRAKSLDLSNFDTSEVTNFTNMFSNNTSLTHLDIRNFTISNDATTTDMFGSLTWPTREDCEIIVKDDATKAKVIAIGQASRLNLTNVKTVAEYEASQS